MKNAPANRSTEKRLNWVYLRSAGRGVAQQLEVERDRQARQRGNHVRLTSTTSAANLNYAWRDAENELILDARSRAKFRRPSGGQSRAHVHHGISQDGPGPAPLRVTCRDRPGRRRVGRRRPQCCRSNASGGEGVEAPWVVGLSGRGKLCGGK